MKSRKRSKSGATIAKDSKDKFGSVFREVINHFRCNKCEKWWSIGDAPQREEWYCTWCGAKQKFKKNKV